MLAERVVAAREGLSRSPLLRAGGSLAVARLTATLSAFVATPVLLAALGPDRFAVYAIGSGAFLYLSVLDLGFSDRCLLVCSAAVSRGDRESAARAVRRAVASYAVAGLGVVLALATSWQALSGVLNVPADLRRESLVLLCLLVLSWFAQKATTCAGSLAALRGRFGRAQVAPAWGVAALPLVAAACAVVQPDLALLGAGQLAVTGLVLAAALLLARQDYAWLSREGGQERPDGESGEVRPAPHRGFGLYVQLSALADIVVFAGDRFLVSAQLGLRGVAGLEVANRPATLVRMVSVAPLPVLFATMARRGADAQESLVRRTSAWQAAVTAVCAAALVGASGPLLELWLPGTIGRDLVLLMQLLVPAYAVHSLTGIYSSALKARGLAGPTCAFSLACALLKTTLFFLLLPTQGLLAVGWASLVGLSLPSVAFMLLVDRRIGLTRDCAPRLAGFVLATAAGSLAGARAADLAGSSPVLGLLLGTASACTVAALAWLFWARLLLALRAAAPSTVPDHVEHR
ncbi:lipopolysaccharide biosynthesis protein [Vallicoccus soli]|uniref:Lipopolysaccharide biosynthesis protein n=1 Tax=Vallicoccus soli TaxID=2339232 RepID=A0A3A3Z1Q9_9ACTN|nr:hypothetical protein [Vallicoccus soli]RJK98180.1 hypothetical protein D5H78_04540 [Vallicoccus soli]